MSKSVQPLLLRYIAEDYAGTIERRAAQHVSRVERIDSMNYMAALDRPGKLIQAYRAATDFAHSQTLLMSTGEQLIHLDNWLHPSTP